VCGSSLSLTLYLHRTGAAVDNDNGHARQAAWYAACPRCTAKVFANATPTRCPRCGSPLLPASPSAMPWRNAERPEAPTTAAPNSPASRSAKR